jgi:flagellar hook-basal body complex protein FliE
MGTANGGPSFGETLVRAIGEVSAAQDRSADYVRQFLAGEPVELHQVMAAAEEAGLALDLLVELRNKVTDAYRTLINMQG